MVSQDPGYRRDPAPLDRAGLAEALRPFGESRMLPRAAYVDPAVFEWEQRNFFGGGWMCVARSEQLPEPGDQRAEATGTGSVLLVRGEDGALRAFANTCRHRGHELLPCGEGARGRMIICPYHAWTYTLGGDLRAAGSFKKVAGFDFGSWGLASLPVTEWHGLVFVDASAGASPSLSLAESSLAESSLAESSLVGSLAKLDEIVAPYEPERLVTAGRHVYDSAANWKILTENYHECYHCPSIHPELCRVSPPKNGENYAADGAWVGGWMGGFPARFRPRLRGGVLGHHQPAGLGRVRVGAARAGLAARLAGTAGARRGRGVLLRHHDRPGLPRFHRVGPGSVGRVTILDVPVKTLAGQDSSLGSAAPGSALLIVNVASKCGLTPQYTALEKLHEQFASRGLAVVGFPCNQFGGQEPGTADEIAEFCSATYGVTFPMFEKIEVNGSGRHPIYDVLTAVQDASGEAGDIMWNFEKFLVRSDGTVAARFRPRMVPDDPEVLAAIEANLPAGYFLG